MDLARRIKRVWYQNRKHMQPHRKLWLRADVDPQLQPAIWIGRSIAEQQQLVALIIAKRRRAPVDRQALLLAGRQRDRPLLRHQHALPSIPTVGGPDLDPVAG